MKENVVDGVPSCMPGKKVQPPHLSGDSTYAEPAAGFHTDRDGQSALCGALNGLRARGLRVDCRAKYAARRTLYWACVLDHTGREMAASGGWYDSEAGATLQAIATLELLKGSNAFQS
jgi:hypothetical protein